MIYKDTLKILLRNNLLLRNIYRNWAQNQEEDISVHFSMNLG